MTQIAMFSEPNKIFLETFRFKEGGEGVYSKK